MYSVCIGSYFFLNTAENYQQRRRIEMKIKREGLGWRIARDLLLLSGLFLILMPLFLVVINSFKTLEEAGKNFFAFPSSFNLNNFKELFQNNNYWIFARNSLIISVISVTFILVLVPAVSYSIARNYTKRYYKSIYYYLLMGLFIPSQVIMLPVTKLMTNLNLLNRTGLILLYLAFSLTQGVFLFVNYIRGLPYEIEESAFMDGCNVFQTYTRIVLPLIKPMISTLLIMDLLWIWNDFMLPLLILNRSQELWTLPLFQYNFKTEYSFDYTMAFTAYLMSMLPMLIVYCLGQKHIIKGLTAGSVKG
jgi:raffinose/stachyose/melibiose transport system permease protein